MTYAYQLRASITRIKWRSNERNERFQNGTPAPINIVFCQGRAVNFVPEKRLFCDVSLLIVLALNRLLCSGSRQDQVFQYESVFPNFPKLGK